MGHGRGIADLIMSLGEKEGYKKFISIPVFVKVRRQMKGRVIKTEEQALDKWRVPELCRLGEKIARKCQKINHKRISSHGKRKKGNVTM